MQDLQKYVQNVVTLDSREVAVMLDKEHSKLLRDVENYSKYLAEAKIGLGDFFLKSTYFDRNNQERPNYQITKKGCEFLAHKLTGQKGAIFTAKYINAFDKMQNHIRQNSIVSPDQNLMTSEALLQILNTQNQILKMLSQNITSTPAISPPKKRKASKRTRKHLIETFPPSVRKLVDTMIISGDFTYKDIQKNLEYMSYKLSDNAIYNYKRNILNLI